MTPSLMGRERRLDLRSLRRGVNLIKIYKHNFFKELGKNHITEQ